MLVIFRGLVHFAILNPIANLFRRVRVKLYCVRSRAIPRIAFNDFNQKYAFPSTNLADPRVFAQNDQGNSRPVTLQSCCEADSRGR